MVRIREVAKKTLVGLQVRGMCWWRGVVCVCVCGAVFVLVVWEVGGMGCKARDSVAMCGCLGSPMDSLSQGRVNQKLKDAAASPETCKEQASLAPRANRHGTSSGPANISVLTSSWTWDYPARDEARRLRLEQGA